MGSSAYSDQKATSFEELEEQEQVLGNEETTEEVVEESTDESNAEAEEESEIEPELRD